jgi:hypothetical protein
MTTQLLFKENSESFTVINSVIWLPFKKLLSVHVLETKIWIDNSYEGTLVIAVVICVEVIWAGATDLYVVIWLEREWNKYSNINRNNSFEVASIKTIREAVFIFYVANYIYYLHLRRCCHYSRTCWNSFLSHCECHTKLIWLDVGTRMIMISFLSIIINFSHTYRQLQHREPAILLMQQLVPMSNLSTTLLCYFEQLVFWRELEMKE